MLQGGRSCPLLFTVAPLGPSAGKHTEGQQMGALALEEEAGRCPHVFSALPQGERQRGGVRCRGELPSSGGIRGRASRAGWERQAGGHVSGSWGGGCSVWGTKLTCGTTKSPSNSITFISTLLIWAAFSCFKISRGLPNIILKINGTRFSCAPNARSSIHPHPGSSWGRSGGARPPPPLPPSRLKPVFCLHCSVHRG